VTTRDKINKKKSSLIEISKSSIKKSNVFTSFDSLKCRVDLISLLNSLQKRLSVKNLLKSYTKIRKDLLDIAKYKEKDRILILVKGKNIEDLFIFPFRSDFWIKNSTKLIMTWHKI